MVSNNSQPEGANGVSKAINRGPSPLPTSPRDSVIVDEGFNKSGFAEVPRSDALRQPLASLDSRIRGSVDIWSMNDSVSQSIDQFLDYVATHRLKHMPHKGSKWDKVLQQSVSLSSQVHRYEEAVTDTLLDSSQAASLIYACLHTLLEVCIS